MAPIVLPFVELFRAKGRIYAYYRRHGRRTRLPGALGSPEFLAAYQSLHQAAEAVQITPQARPEAPDGSFGALVAAYRASPNYRRLAQNTRADYDRLLAPLLRKAGAMPVATLPRAWILDHRDALQDTPRKANKLVAVLRLLLAFAVDREWRADNPARGIKPLPTGPGHRVWTEAEIGAMAGPAAGAVALPVLLALYTAQRLGDVLPLLWSAFDGHAITLRQRKTGAWVTIPAHPELRRVLEATPRTAAVICLTERGRPWRTDHFKHRFAAVRAELGLPPDLHFHGLRHTAGRDMAESGSSDAEIQSVTGHKTRAMVEKYTRQARQGRLAEAAIAKLPNRRKE